MGEMRSTNFPAYISGRIGEDGFTENLTRLMLFAVRGIAIGQQFRFADLVSHSHSSPLKVDLRYLALPTGFEPVLPP